MTSKIAPALQAERCDKYVDSSEWVLICGDSCRCSSPLCGDCRAPLQYHRDEIKDAWFDSPD